MKKTLRIWTLVSAVLLAGTATAAAKAGVNHRTGLFEPPLSDLRKAAERGDRAELARAASRLGPARLAQALDEPDRRMVLAALEAVPLIVPGLLLLDNVVSLFTSTDSAIRERAVGTVSALLAGGDADRLAEWEIPAESARASCKGLAVLAANESEPLSIRLSAVQGIDGAGATCAGSLGATELLSSREPDIRRAAVLALPAGPSAYDALLAAANDGDGRVAAAAGARLCRRQTKNRSFATQPPLRQLALARGAAPEDIVELLPCLAASTDPADAKALEELKAADAAGVREAISRLKEGSR